jgi:hypothetical protein
MGIEIEMFWKGMTEAEQEAQRTIDGPGCGAVGRLRENYHDGYHFARYLFREAFQATPCDAISDYCYKKCKPHDGDYFCGRVNYGIAEIPADRLKRRFPAALEMAIAEWDTPDSWQTENGLAYLQDMGDFVALAERKEKETGQPVWVRVAP